MGGFWTFYSQNTTKIRLILTIFNLWNYFIWQKRQITCDGRLELLIRSRMCSISLPTTKGNLDRNIRDHQRRIVTQRQASKHIMGNYSLNNFTRSTPFLHTICVRTRSRRASRLKTNYVWLAFGTRQNKNSDSALNYSI